MNADSQIDPKVVALCDLMQLMSRLVVPPPTLQPKPVDLEGNPAQLAIDSANSSELIARAVADLGMGKNDARDADTIWRETLNQIGRVQANFGWPSLPFQKQPKPVPPGGRASSR